MGGRSNALIYIVVVIIALYFMVGFILSVINLYRKKGSDTSKKSSSFVANFGFYSQFNRDRIKREFGENPKLFPQL